MGRTANSNNNSLNTADTRPNTVTTGANERKTQKTGNKIRKPIDLGAAASFATQDSSKSKQLSNNSSSVTNSVSNKSNLDLFGINDDYDGKNLNSQQPSSLVITGDDDEFDPRGLSRYV